MRTAKEKPQRLKPHSFCGVYVVAEATTHKHFRDATETQECLTYYSSPNPK
jgi:hypothetical protein